ncbi:MAG: SET domain-containing protein-lysine N-methyltransferase [Chloroflexota bacterium]
MSAIEGKGGFARDLIRMGEIVVIIGGTVFSEAEFNLFAATTAQYDAIQIGEDLHLVDLSPDPRATNGSLNHSCDSNLWMQDEVTLIARCDIQPGEEVTVDYALFTAVPNWRLDATCRCNSPTCRHQVTGEDWKRPDLQARYSGHFSPFLNARIAAAQS